MKFRFLPRARTDISEQVLYLVEHATPAIARRFLDNVEAASHKMSCSPTIGTPVLPERSSHGMIRSWPVPSFPAVRLYYEQRQDEILIVRVLHGKRDIPHLL